MIKTGFSMSGEYNIGEFEIVTRSEVKEDKTHGAPCVENTTSE
jgi:hypothetical protein